MSARYGWQYRLSQVGSRLAARRAKRQGPLGIGIEIAPRPPVDDPAGSTAV